MLGDTNPWEGRYFMSRSFTVLWLIIVHVGGVVGEHGLDVGFSCQDCFNEESQQARVAWREQAGSLVRGSSRQAEALSNDLSQNGYG